MDVGSVTFLSLSSQAYKALPEAGRERWPKSTCNSSLIPWLLCSFTCPLLSRKTCPTTWLAVTVGAGCVLWENQYTAPSHEPGTITISRAIRVMSQPLRFLPGTGVDGGAGGMGVAGDNGVSVSAREERTGVLSTGVSAECCPSGSLLAGRGVAFAASVTNVSSADAGSTSLGEMPDGCASMAGAFIVASGDEGRLICEGRVISSASATA